MLTQYVAFEIIMCIPILRQKQDKGLEPRDANFLIAYMYHDSLTGIRKGTDGWFINAVIKHLRNRYLQ